MSMKKEWALRRPLRAHDPDPEPSDLSAGWAAHRPTVGGMFGSSRWTLFAARKADTALAAARIQAGGHRMYISREGNGSPRDWEWRVPTFAPPGDIADLPFLLHELEPLPERKAHALPVVFLPDIHEVFPARRAPEGRGEPSPPPTIAAPTYVLARLVHLAYGHQTGAFRLIASAQEDELLLRAPDLFAGRGAACHLEVRREPGDPAKPAEPSGPGSDELAAANGLGKFRAIALHAPDPAVRAAAADRAAEADPDDRFAALLRGNSLADRKQLAEAAASFRRAAELDPNLAAAHFELGKVLLRLDDMDGALAAFGRTTEELPEFAPGWANFGAALGEFERPEEALAAVRRASELDPLSHSLLSNLGITLRDLDRLEEAEEVFARVLEMAPDFVFGHYNLAGVVYLRGRFDEAVALFEKARAMDPSGSGRQRLMLAVARLAAGDEEGSLDEYRATFEGLEGQMRLDMKTVAQWDLRRLSERVGITPAIRKAADLVKGVRA